MLEQIPWDLFCEWRSFYEQAPWGDLRDDMRSGIIASTIANVHRDSKKRPTAYRPDDFMPFLKESQATSHTATYDPVTDAERFNRMSGTVRAAYGRPRRRPRRPRATT